MTPPFRKLRIMLEVSRLGSISNAAQQFGLSQPAASRAVKSLEAALGTTLFHRERGGMRLTKPGELIGNRMRRTVGMLESAERDCGCAPGAIALRSAGHELHAIEAIAEAGTLGGAARARSISQPALTQSLRSFERRCNIQLFFRAISGMRPTPQGERIIRLVKLALREIEAGLDEIAVAIGKRGGKFSIGALPLARSELVPAAIDIVLERYSDARVRVYDGNYSSMLSMLQSGDIDVIIGTLRDHPPSEEVVSKILFDDDMIVISRPEHPLLSQAGIGFANALAYDWVLPFEGVPLRTQFEKFVSGLGWAMPSHAIEADSVAVLRTLVMNSDRLAIVSRHQVPLELRHGLLVRLPLEISRIDRKIGLTYRAGYIPTPLGAAFEDAFIMAASRV